MCCVPAAFAARICLATSSASTVVKWKARYRAEERIYSVHMSGDPPRRSTHRHLSAKRSTD